MTTMEDFGNAISDLTKTVDAMKEEREILSKEILTDRVIQLLCYMDSDIQSIESLINYYEDRVTFRF